MRPKKITLAWLTKRGANCDGLTVFAQEWPNGAELTRANLLRAAELGLDVGWFGEIFLSVPLLAEYSRQRDSLWAEYHRQNTPLLAEHQRQLDLLLAEYQRQTAPLWAEYHRHRAPLLAEFERQAAICLAAVLGLE